MAYPFKTPIKMGGNQIEDLRAENLASLPAASSSGRLAYSGGALNLDNGSAWLTLATLASPNFTATPTAPTAAPGTNTTQLATTAFVQAAASALGAGDMLKSVYDTNNDGVVDAAATVPWGGVGSKPTTIAGYGLTDAVPTARSIATGTGLSGGGDLSANRSLSLANTTVAAGAYGGGTVVATFTVDAQGRLTAAGNTTISIPASAVSDSSAQGRAILQAANGAALNTAVPDGTFQLSKLAAIAGARIVGNNTGSAAVPFVLTGAQVKAMLALAAADIPDLAATVTSLMAANWDTAAGVLDHLDTIAEAIPFLDNLATVAIKRYEQTFGDGTATSFNIDHALNSKDITVEVYDVASGATVLCDVVRSTVNRVVIGATPAPTASALRVVIKK